jgi:hypothetical protein
MQEKIKKNKEKNKKNKEKNKKNEDFFITSIIQKKTISNKK